VAVDDVAVMVVSVLVVAVDVVQQMSGAALPNAANTGHLPEIESKAAQYSVLYLHGPTVSPLQPSHLHAAAVGAGAGGGGQVWFSNSFMLFSTTVFDWLCGRKTQHVFPFSPHTAPLSTVSLATDLSQPHPSVHNATHPIKTHCFARANPTAVVVVVVVAVVVVAVTVVDLMSGSGKQ